MRDAAPRGEAAPERARVVRARSAARKWIRIARGRFPQVARRGGTIRPAAYPIREFLAWRR